MHGDENEHHDAPGRAVERSCISHARRDKSRQLVIEGLLLRGIGICGRLDSRLLEQELAMQIRDVVLVVSDHVILQLVQLQGHVDMGVKDRRSQKMQQAQKTKVLPFVGCAREEEHRSDQLTFFHFSDQPISESRPNLGIVVEVMSFVYKNKIPRFAREHALFSRPIVELERIHRSHDKVVHGPEVAACRIRLGTIPLGANVKHLEHSLDPLIYK